MASPLGSLTTDHLFGSLEMLVSFKVPLSLFFVSPRSSLPLLPKLLAETSILQSSPPVNLSTPTGIGISRVFVEKGRKPSLAPVCGDMS